MTVVIAHRGASKTHPENTADAFVEAVRLGAEWIELDVRRTKDNLLAIHHDSALPDGREIIDLNAAELPVSVPNLEQALAACAGSKVNIEIKNDPDEHDFDPERSVVAQVVAVALAAMDPADLLISSFDYPTVELVRHTENSLDTALLFWTKAELVDVVAEASSGGHRSINAFDPLVTAELVQQAHAAGLEVNVWTVDDPARMTELVSFGVDGIVTNDPETARRILDI